MRFALLLLASCTLGYRDFTGARIACQTSSECTSGYFCSPITQQCERERDPTAPLVSADTPARDPVMLRLSLTVKDDNSDTATIAFDNPALQPVSVQASPLGVRVDVEAPLAALFGDGRYRPDAVITGTASDGAREAAFSLGPFAVGNDAPAITALTLSTPDVSGLVLMQMTVTDSTADQVALSDVRLSTSGSIEDAMPLMLNDATFPAGSRLALVTSPEGFTHTIAWDSSVSGPLTSQTAALFVRVSDASDSAYARVGFNLLNNAPPAITNVRVGPTAYRTGNGLMDVWFDIADPEGDLASVRCEYSLDTGRSYIPCVEAPMPDGDLLRNLPATRVHFVWDVTGLSNDVVRRSTLRLSPDDGFLHPAPAVAVASTPFPAGPQLTGVNSSLFAETPSGGGPMFLAQGTPSSFVFHEGEIAWVSATHVGVSSVPATGEAYAAIASPGVAVASFRGDVMVLSLAGLIRYDGSNTPTGSPLPLVGSAFAEGLTVGKLDGDDEDDLIVRYADGTFGVFFDDVEQSLSACVAKHTVVFEHQIVSACADGMMRVWSASLEQTHTIPLSALPQAMVVANGQLCVVSEERIDAYAPDMTALPQWAPTNTPAVSAEAFDFNGDGTQDLVIGALGDLLSTFAVLPGVGIASLGRIDGVPAEHRVLIAGRSDALWSFSTGRAGTVYVQRTSPALTVDALSAPQLLISRASNDFCVTDLNLDGYLDVVTVDKDTVVAHLRKQGTFDLRESFDTLTMPSPSLGFAVHRLSCGDLDGDGTPEVVVRGDNIVATYRYAPSGMVGMVTFPVASPSWVRVVDVDNDGAGELVVASGPSGLYTVSATGAIAPLVTFSQGIVTPLVKPVVWNGDLNGDGLTDFVAGAAAGSGIQIALNTGAGFSLSTLGSAVGAPPAVEVADLNEDGYLDLYAHAQPGVQEILGSSGGFVAQTPQFPNNHPNMDGQVYVFDIDQDAVDEVVMLGNSMINVNLFADARFTIPFIGLSAHAPNALVDFDRDGLPDVLSLTGDNFVTVRWGQNQNLAKRITANGITKLRSGADASFLPRVKRVQPSAPVSRLVSHVYRVEADQGLEVVMHDGVARRRPAPRRTGAFSLTLPRFAGAAGPNEKVYRIHTRYMTDEDGFLPQGPLHTVQDVTAIDYTNTSGNIRIETDKGGEFAILSD